VKLPVQCAPQLLGRRNLSRPGRRPGRVGARCREWAGFRSRVTTQRRPAEMHRSQGQLSAAGTRAVRRADVHPSQDAPRLPRRGGQGVVLSPRAGPQALPGRPRDSPCSTSSFRSAAGRPRRRTGRRAAGQDPTRQPPSGRSTAPRGPADGCGRLRASRSLPAHRHLHRAQAQHRHLRRATARRPAALNHDARGLTTARPGPPRRPHPAGGRLRTIPGPGRRVSVHDRRDASQDNASSQR